MEQKIELEIRLRELAAQSMLEARNEIDVLEVEKSLLTSDQRMNCYASLLEQQRKQLSNPSLSTADSGRGSKNGNYRRSTNNSRYSDVIGGGQTTSGSTPNGSVVNDHQQSRNLNQNNTTSSCSPSFSSLSNSQTSPSKLSPVSGESANSPSSMSSSSRRSQNSQANQRTATTNQQLLLNNNNTNLNNNNNQPTHLRQNHSRRSTNNINSTLSAKQKAKNKKREQLMQTITSLSNINCNMVVDNRASISASEIRIPLMWKDVDHFKGRGDYKRYAIFCLLKIDSQIYDTQLISDVDREVTDVTFDDLVVFNEIDHNFELILEVYSCVYYEQFSLSSTPRKLKEKLTNSVSKAMGRRLATQTASINYTKELEAYDKSYRFAMIASATMRLDDVSNKVKTYDLVLTSSSALNHNLINSKDSSFNQSHHLIQSSTNSPSTISSATKSIYSTKMANNYNNNKDANKNTLPLFGHFCCKLMVKPDVFDKNIKTGYLKVASINVPSRNNHPSDSTLESSGRGSKSPSSTSTSSPSSQSSIMNHASSAESAAKFKLANIAASNKMATLSLSSSTLHWGLLRNFVLYLWPVNEKTIDLNTLRSGEMPHLENPRKPRLILNIDKYSRLLRVSNSSLTIETDKGCFVLGAYCPPVGVGDAINYNQADELAHWLRTIEQHIYDSHIWGSVLNHYPPHTKQSMNSSLQPPTRRLSDNRENTSSMLMDNNNANTAKKPPSYRDHYGGSAILQAHS